MRWFLLFAPLIFCLLLGCQRYSRLPTDLSGHDAEVLGRSPEDRKVADFAAKMAKQGQTTNNYDPGDGLSLVEAEVVALFFNPQLRAARLKANIPLVRAREARRWEDPTLDVDGERIIESVEEPWVLGASLSITIPLSGRLNVEKRKAYAEADVEQLRVYLEEQTLLTDLRTKWVEWSAAQERLTLLQQYVKDLDPLIASVKKLADLGEVGRGEARLFEVERVSRLVEMAALEASTQDAKFQIKALMGLAPTVSIEMVPSVVTTLAVLDPQARLERAMKASPRLRVAEAEYELAEHLLHLEIRKQYSDLTIGGGAGTEEGQSRILFGGSIPLPLWNRNRQGIAEAFASRSATKASAEAAYESLLHDMARAEANLIAVRRRFPILENELIPLVDRQVAEARELGQMGEFNSLVVLEGLRSAYEAKLQVVEVRVAEATAIDQLRSLTGPLVVPAIQKIKEKP
jgi:outer membrane protein, heavy metal efflux system